MNHHTAVCLEKPGQGAAAVITVRGWRGFVSPTGKLATRAQVISLSREPTQMLFKKARQAIASMCYRMSCVRRCEVYARRNLTVVRWQLPVVGQRPHGFLLSLWQAAPQSRHSTCKLARLSGDARSHVFVNVTQCYESRPRLFSCQARFGTPASRLDKGSWKWRLLFPRRI